MDNLCLRSYIKTRLLLGLTATEIHNELTLAYGQDIVSYRTVARWFRRFSNERDSLEDNPRSGRPLSAITQENIDAVKHVVNDDPHISMDFIATSLDRSHDSKNIILKQHVGLRKISSSEVLTNSLKKNGHDFFIFLLNILHNLLLTISKKKNQSYVPPTILI
jgi:transposase